MPPKPKDKPKNEPNGKPPKTKSASTERAASIEGFEAILFAQSKRSGLISGEKKKKPKKPKKPKYNISTRSASIVGFAAGISLNTRSCSILGKKTKSKEKRPPQHPGGKPLPPEIPKEERKKTKIRMRRVGNTIMVGMNISAAEKQDIQDVNEKKSQFKQEAIITQMAFEDSAILTPTMLHQMAKQNKKENMGNILLLNNMPLEKLERYLFPNTIKLFDKIV